MHFSLWTSVCVCVCVSFCALCIFKEAILTSKEATTTSFWYSTYFRFLFINSVTICVGIGRSEMYCDVNSCFLGVSRRWSGIAGGGLDRCCFWQWVCSAILATLPPVSLMAARPRAKVTGALAPVQMALLTAITHSANKTARDGAPALPLAAGVAPHICIQGKRRSLICSR